MNAAIRFENVHRHFDTQAVLRGLNFSVDRGEVFALLGRNGAGKTTALRTLLGFLQPHAGSTSVLGVDSRRLRPSDRARISFVGEDHRLYDTMRVRDAVGFEAGTRPAFRRDVVDRAIERCGLPRTRHILRLSRGQRAQLALILAVGSEPEVLIFDDPALGLDAAMRRELLDAMIDLLADVGCAVLLSSHHLQDVERMADRVGILRDGALVVDADLAELKQRLERRFWQPAAGAETGPPQGVENILAHRRIRDGFELTLRDVDAELEARLSADGATLGPRDDLTLEDTFLNLAGGSERTGIFSEAE